jgi:hypothetical protein
VIFTRGRQILELKDGLFDQLQVNRLGLLMSSLPDEYDSSKITIVPVLLTALKRADNYVSALIIGDRLRASSRTLARICGITNLFDRVHPAQVL